MNRIPSSKTSSREPIDDLLGTFFRSEVPEPWPGPPWPNRGLVPSRPADDHRHAGSSRWALAASVALLLFAGWLLSGILGQAPQVPTAPGMQPGTAGKGMPMPMPGPMDR